MSEGTDLQIGHLPPKSESIISITDEVLSKNTLSHDKQATMKNIHSLNTDISHYTFPSQLAGYEPLPE